MTDSAESALVEVSAGTALVFGKVPEGLELIPFSLIPEADKTAFVDAVAAASSILNVGGQLASALAQAQGIVRLAPQTIQALHAGAAPINSGGYYLGTLSHAGKFSNSVRWLPATGANAAGIIASLGPAIAMIAIQLQLSELSGLVRQNLALTETVLKSVRNAQWAELTGLDKAVSNAINEANAIGHVTPLVWQNIAGHEAELQKQRDLFRRNVEGHAAELTKHASHKERREYISKNGEAILLDLYSLLIAHKAWFEYQSLRAGRARLEADTDEREAKLLNTIVANAGAEYENTVAEITRTVDVLHRELWILAELPGKRTIPFTDGRRSARDVAAMARQVLDGVNSMSSSSLTVPPPIELPELSFVEMSDGLDEQLAVLRWFLDGDERLEAIAVARDGDSGFAAFSSAVAGFGGAIVDGVGGVTKAVGAVGESGMFGVSRAWRKGAESNLRAVVEPGIEILIAVTQKRVLVAESSQLRQDGLVRSFTANDQIRFARLTNDDANGRAELDFITTSENQKWRFRRGSASSEPVKQLAQLLNERVDTREATHDAISAATPDNQH